MTTAPRNQFGTATSDGARGAIFAWQDDRAYPNVSDIYVQRLDASGAPRWKVDGVNIAVATDYAGQHVGKSLQVITTDGAGGAIVAWLDNRILQNDVFAQRVAANGTVMWQANGVPVGIACWTNGCANQKAGVQIASDGAGGAIITWYETRDGFHLSVWAQRIRPDGTPAWTVNGVPVAFGSFHADFPKVASDGSGGAFIAWQEPFVGGVFAQRLDATGAAKWMVNGIQVASSIAQAGGGGHQVIGDGASGAILVWVDGRNVATSADIYAQRLNAAGVELWQAGGVSVCTRTANQYTPVLTTDGAGGAIFAWEDQGVSPPGSGQQWVMGQRVNGAGVVQWATNGVAIYAYHALAPHILSDGAGGAFVGWGSVLPPPSTLGPIVYLQHVDGNGQVLWGSSGFDVSNLPTSHYISSPGLLSDDAGGALVYWQDFRFTGGDSQDIFANRVNDQVPAPPPTFADLWLALVASPEHVTVGGNLTYTATVGNAGPETATHVAFNSEVPPASSLFSMTSTQGTCVGGGTVSCNLGSLGPGSTATVTFVVTTGAPVILTDTCYVFGSQPDPDITNNSASAVTGVGNSVPPFTDLAIAKTDGLTTASPGQTITYTIVATNLGPNPANGATVTDSVPTALTNVTWTCAGANGGMCTASGSGNISDAVNLLVGATVTYTLTGTINPAAHGSLSNTARVAVPAGVTDPNPANNSATDTDVLPGPNYFSLAPCRVVDTRGGAPISGPALQGQQTRVFAVVGICGIPSTASALSVNLAVTQSTAAGNLRLFPAGQAVPTVSVINYVAGQTRANNAIVTLDFSGQMAAFVGQATGTTVHLIIDVNGYFQ